MAAVAKDLTIGSVIMVGCIALLAVAFSTPSNSSQDSDEPVIAGADFGGPDVPPVTPYTPPQPDNNESSSAFSENDIFDEQPAQPIVTELGQDEEPIVMGIDEVDQTETDSPFGGDESIGDTGPDWGAPPVEGDALVETEIGTPIQEQDEPDLPQVAPPVQARLNVERTHTVVSGETYRSISSQYYDTPHKWRQIKAANDANQYDLMPGMILKIPVLEESAPVSTAPTTVVPSGPRSYKVQSGDSYYTIARDQLGNAQRYKELESLNGIDPLDLQVGMTLKLPARGSAVAVTATTSSAPVAPAGAKIHVVELGEILGDISMEYYGTSRRWRVIADANGISDATSLREGQRLIIPDAGSRTARVAGGSSTRQSAEPRGDGLWHEVKKDETFQVISLRYYGTTTRHDEIATANPSLDPIRLQIGARVWVPNAVASSSESSSVREVESPPVIDFEPIPVSTPDQGIGPDWDSVSP